MIIFYEHKPGQMDGLKNGHIDLTERELANVKGVVTQEIISGNIVFDVFEAPSGNGAEPVIKWVISIRDKETTNQLPLKEEVTINAGRVVQ